MLNQQHVELLGRMPQERGKQGGERGVISCYCKGAWELSESYAWLYYSLLFPAGAQGPVKIGIVQGFSGALEAYAKQMLTGFKLGLEYGTKGKNEVSGRKVELIVEDDQLKPDVAKRLITKFYADDKVDLVVGTTSSAAALAMLPVALEFKKILLVEPAVADSITGSAWNRYIFRTGRNSGQDAISNAKAVAKPGVFLAAIAQDYAFGRDGIAAYKAAAEKLGAKMVHEEYCPMAQTDHTSSAQRIIDALKDKPGEKYVFVVWAGKHPPIEQMAAMKIEKYGIKITTGGNILPVLKATLPLLKAFESLEGHDGGSLLFYELPKNAVNDWLVKEHTARFKEPPDFFTCGGFAAAMAAVAALEKAEIDGYREADLRHGGDGVHDSKRPDDFSERGPSGPAVHVHLFKFEG